MFVLTGSARGQRWLSAVHHAAAAQRGATAHNRVFPNLVLIGLADGSSARGSLFLRCLSF